MNKLLEFADFIESLPTKKFGMQKYVHCDSPSCIAGWAAWFALGKPEELYDVDNIIRAACDYLDLPETYAVTKRLFAGEYNCGFLSTITPSEAAAGMRHFAATGTIDWKEFPAGVRT